MHDGIPFYEINPVDTINGKPPPPRPPRYLYGDYNIILENDTTLFYHQKSKRLICGTGIDPDKPKFINLQPSDLIQMHSDSFLIFLENKILPKKIIRNEKQDPIIVVALMHDTLKSKTIKSIVSTFRRVKFYNYVIRRINEEELMVLTARQNHQTYEPDKIKWKSEFEDYK